MSSVRRRALLTPAIGLLVAITVSSNALADSGPEWTFFGSSPVAEAGDKTQVEMTREHVKLHNLRAGEGKLFGWLMDVEATFVLTNRGSETERVKMWFPLCELYENAFYMNKAVTCPADPDRPTSVTVDGSPLPFTTDVPSPPKHDDWLSVTAKLRFEAEFAPGQARTLTVRYMTASYHNWDKGPRWPAGFEYVLHTGADWYGPIGKGTISMELPYRARPYNAHLSHTKIEQFGSNWDPAPGLPVEYTGNTIEFRFEKLEPTEQDDLYFAVLVPDFATALERALDAEQLEPALQTRLALASQAAFSFSAVPGVDAAFAAAVSEALPKLQEEDYPALQQVLRDTVRAAAHNRETECRPATCANLDLARQLHMLAKPGSAPNWSYGFCCHDFDRPCDVPGGDCEGERTPAKFAAVLRTQWTSCLDTPDSCDIGVERVAVWEDIVRSFAEDHAAVAACRLGLGEHSLPRLGDLLKGKTPGAFWNHMRPLFAGHVLATERLQSEDDARAETCFSAGASETHTHVADAGTTPAAEPGKPASAHKEPGEEPAESGSLGREIGIAVFGAMIGIGLALLFFWRKPKPPNAPSR